MTTLSYPMLQLTKSQNNKPTNALYTLHSLLHLLTKVKMVEDWSDAQAMQWVISARPEDATRRAQALGLLHDRYYLKIKRSLSMLYPGLTPAHAEEFAQEAFVNAMKKASQFEGNSSVKTWIMRIAINLVKTAYRREKIAPMVSVDSDEDLAFAVELASATMTTPMSSLELQELVNCVQKKFEAFRRTNPQPAWALWVRFVEDMSPQDIADLLEKKSGAMRQYLSDWAKKLRLTLAPCHELL